MYTITKEFHFAASHSLKRLPTDHPCSRLHGHNYVVIVELRSHTLDEQDFVIDYGKLNLIRQYIDTKLDHQHLNAVLEFNPTAENIARHIYDVFKKTFPKLSAVTVKETPKTTARYELTQFKPQEEFDE